MKLSWVSTFWECAKEKNILKFNLVLTVVIESKDLQLSMITFPLCAHRPSILFIRSFVRSFVRACVHGVRSFVRSCIRSFIQAASAVLAAWPASLLYRPCKLIDRWWIPYYTRFSEQCHIMSHLVPSVRTQKPLCAQWPVYNMVT